MHAGLHAHADTLKKALSMRCKARKAEAHATQKGELNGGERAELSGFKKTKTGKFGDSPMTISSTSLTRIRSSSCKKPGATWALPWPAAPALSCANMCSKESLWNISNSQQASWSARSLRLQLSATGSEAANGCTRWIIFFSKAANLFRFRSKKSGFWNTPSVCWCASATTK